MKNTQNGAEQFVDGISCRMDGIANYTTAYRVTRDYLEQLDPQQRDQLAEEYLASRSLGNATAIDVEALRDALMSPEENPDGYIATVMAIESLHQIISGKAPERSESIETRLEVAVEKFDIQDRKFGTLNELFDSYMEKDIKKERRNDILEVAGNLGREL